MRRAVKQVMICATLGKRLWGMSGKLTRHQSLCEIRGPGSRLVVDAWEKYVFFCVTGFVLGVVPILRLDQSVLDDWKICTELQQRSHRLAKRIVGAGALWKPKDPLQRHRPRREPRAAWFPWQLIFRRNSRQDFADNEGNKWVERDCT